MATKALQIDVNVALSQLSSALEIEIDRLVETMVLRMREQVPDFDVDSKPELRSAEMDSCYANVRAATSALGSDRQTPSPLPSAAIAEVRTTARAGVPLDTLLHTYRIGHAVVLESAIDCLARMDLDPATRHAALTIGSRYLFAYVDTLSAGITQEYTAERDRLMRTGIQRRVQLVREVLEGANIGGSELGYHLEGEHLSLIADGPGADAYLSSLESELSRQLLTVAVSESTVWAWLGSRTRIGPDFWKRLAGLCPPTGVSIAIGEPAWGLEGFRESHSQALAANRVAGRITDPMVRYSDVSLEATLMTDPEAARRFVNHELGPLAEENERSEKLRLTLEAYLRTGMNASAAAAVLIVSDRTVAYRIRRVEEILGLTVTRRSAELAAALRMKRLYS